MPKPKLTWLFNGRELTNKDNVKFETDAKTSANYLVMPKVSVANIGAYIIKASNSVGEIEHTFNLDVLGKNQVLIVACKFKHLLLLLFDFRNTKIRLKIRKCHCK